MIWLIVPVYLLGIWILGELFRARYKREMTPREQAMMLWCTPLMLIAILFDDSPDSGRDRAA